MKRAARFLRIAVFAGALAVLLKGPSQPRAQRPEYPYSDCEKFSTEYVYCPSCCSQHPDLPEMIDGVDKIGMYDAVLYNYSCGTPPSCQGESCSGSYYQAVLTFEQCCAATGQYCDSDVHCCDLSSECRSNSCCETKGEDCTQDSDCCSGICDIEFSTCVG